MNNKLTSFLYIIIFLFNACSADTVDNSIVEPGANSTGNMFFQIEGIEQKADIVKAYRQAEFTTVEGVINTLSLTSNFSSINLKIVIKNLKEPRLYCIGESGNGFVYNVNAKLIYRFKDGSPDKIYVGQYVENLSLIDITKLTERQIAGSFGFRASDKKTEPEFVNITNGRFEITF